jgi:signal transduction histidine kinase
LWEQAERLRKLTDQILDLSRIDARAIEIRREPLVLEPFIRRVVEDVAGDRVADVQIHAAAELEAAVDAGALERVLGNLIANAVEYGAPPVVVSAVAVDNELRICVEDGGPGIPPEQATQIFDRFERGDASRGSGLGLAIAQTYARAHGGEVVHRPEAASRFELILPAA